MILLRDRKHMLFLGGPHVATVEELRENHMHLCDIPLHSATRELVMINHSRQSEVEVK